MVTHLDELREDQTGRAGTDQQYLGAKGHLELVHAVNGARGGLEQGGLLVGKVLDLVALGKVASCQIPFLVGTVSPIPRWYIDVLGDVFGKATVHGNTLGGKMLAEELLAFAAVVAVTAGGYVSVIHPCTDISSGAICL